MVSRKPNEDAVCSGAWQAYTSLRYYRDGGSTQKIDDWHDFFLAAAGAAAVCVGLFHRDPERARSLVERWLAPGGAVFVFFVFDPPSEPGTPRRASTASPPDRSRVSP